jgi:hypothetical protein
METTISSFLDDSSSPSDFGIHMEMTPSIVVIIYSLATPKTCVKVMFEQSMRANMDYGGIFISIPSNGNFGKDSYSDIVKNVSCSPPLNQFLV